MAFVHGKSAAFKLDNPAGSLVDISTFLNSVSGLPGKTDRPETTTFGGRAVRRELKGLEDGGTISLKGPLQLVSGTKVHGKGTKFLLGDYAPQAYFNAGSVKMSAKADDPTQCFGATAVRREVVGHVDGKVDLTYQYDATATSGPHALGTGLMSASTISPFTLAFDGWTAGNIVLLGGIAGDSLAEDSGFGVQQGKLSAVVDDGLVCGISLHDLVAETDGNAHDYDGIDETAAAISANGGMAHLHVTAFAGTDVTFKVQHSVNNTDWTDLGTFTQLTAVGSQRLPIALGTTINRYVRAQISAGAYTSVTFVMALARYDAAYGTAGTLQGFANLIGKSASSSFEYGPGGSAGGAVKESGECRATEVSVDFDVNSPLEVSVSLVVDGAVALGTF